MNGGEAQRNRLLEASMANGPQEWPSKPLFSMVNDAVTTAMVFSELTAQPRHIVSDEEYCRADEAAYIAKMALLEFLWEHHGITRSMVRNLGGIL